MHELDTVSLQIVVLLHPLSVHPRCTHARKHIKTFRKNLKLRGNDHQQMLWGLAKFGGQITFEELSTKKTKSLKISQNVSALFEQIL